MSLAPRDKLGPYEILDLIGKGGMGEVYRARDTKLHREVAVKVLAPALAADADYLTRFQREAQVLASLNHPNIATIYGLEGNAIIMELVEGETLRTPLPVAEALPVARQIVEALEAAHEKGITHRDLRPGNIKVTPEGVVKVLDFGLAKTPDKPVPQSGANSPTLTVRATESGLILGTAGYMSPEQAAGKPVDRRADIWAFGVILWEMLAGKRLFEGETIAHTLADVLRADIDLNKLPADTPPAIRELIRRCLDRNLKNRLSSISEARYAIDHCHEGTRAAAQPIASRSSSRLPWVLTAAASLLAIALLGWTLWSQRSAEPAVPSAFDIAPPEGTEFAGGASISPNGRLIAFRTVTQKGDLQLYLRRLESREAALLPGTDGVDSFFWSPDSQAIAFQSSGKLRRTDIAGQTISTICDAPALPGGSWSEQGVIVMGQLLGSLHSVPASGGTPTPVTKLSREAGEQLHREPRFLPGGRQFLYSVRYSDPQKDALFVGSLDGKPPVKLLESVRGGVYDPTSEHLLYVLNDGTLMARRMKLNRLELTGQAVQVVRGVSNYRNLLQFSLSQSGSMLYTPEPAAGKARFHWIDRSGQAQEPVSDPIPVTNDFRLSPDQRRIAYAAGPSGEIWMLDLERGLTSRFTFRPSQSPRWSPDGKYLYYIGSGAIYRKLSDGSGEEEMVLPDGSGGRIDSISPDGNHLLFLGAKGIWRLPLTGERKAEPFLSTQYVEGSAVVSPNGRWVAYHSNESGRFEIYVTSFPDRKGKWQISTDGGREPFWRSDGKELLWQPPGEVMSAAIDTEAQGIRPGRPQVLFRWRGGVQPAPNGKRFLALRSEGGTPYRPPMVVLLNWTAQLKER